MTLTEFVERCPASSALFATPGDRHGKTIITQNANRHYPEGRTGSGIYAQRSADAWRFLVAWRLTSLAFGRLVGSWGGASACVDQLHEQTTEHMPPALYLHADGVVAVVSVPGDVVAEMYGLAA